MDQTILRLIGKWLKVGVLEEGIRTRKRKGVPQGGVISPLLANIYLHYALDLWITKKAVKVLNGRIFLNLGCICMAERTSGADIKDSRMRIMTVKAIIKE